MNDYFINNTDLFVILTIVFFFIAVVAIVIAQGFKMDKSDALDEISDLRLYNESLERELAEGTQPVQVVVDKNEIAKNLASAFPYNYVGPKKGSSVAIRLSNPAKDAIIRTLADKVVLMLEDKNNTLANV